jgi:hypothetical protein
MMVMTGWQAVAIMTGPQPKSQISGELCRSGRLASRLPLPASTFVAREFFKTCVAAGTVFLSGLGGQRF